jgi:hypothetical protein
MRADSADSAAMVMSDFGRSATVQGAGARCLPTSTRTETTVPHHVRIRRFLNLPAHHAGAYVYAHVGDSAACDEPGCTHDWCTDFELTMADCGRVVSLAFEVRTAAERRNSRRKITTLIDALEQFRDALEIESTRAAARSRRGRARRSVDV